MLRTYAVCRPCSLRSLPRHRLYSNTLKLSDYLEQSLGVTIRPTHKLDQLTGGDLLMKKKLSLLDDIRAEHEQGQLFLSDKEAMNDRVPRHIVPPGCDMARLDPSSRPPVMLVEGAGATEAPSMSGADADPGPAATPYPFNRRGPHHIVHPPSKALLRHLEPILAPPADAQVAKVALIGPANAGKSTLLNRLVGAHVSITSNKAQTTREHVLGVLTEASTQLIFYDTPGLAPPRVKVEPSIAMSPWTAAQEVDHVLFLYDASYPPSLTTVKHYLSHLDKQALPVYLVLNKMDAVGPPPSRLHEHALRERDLLLARFPCIQRTFMISALARHRLAELKAFLLSLAVPSAWLYAPTQRSLLSQVEMALEVVREKIYRKLYQEVPYMIQQELVSWDDRTDPSTLHVHVLLHVACVWHARMVIGTAGAVIKSIQEDAEQMLSVLFQKRVRVHCYHKLSPHLYHLH